MNLILPVLLAVLLLGTLCYLFSLTRKLQSMQHRFIQAQASLEAVNLEREKSKQNLASSKAEKSALGGKYAKLEKENRFYREQSSKVEAAYQEKSSLLEGELQGTKDQLDSLKQQNHSMLGQLKTLDAERSQLARQLKDADQSSVKLKKLQQQVKQYESMSSDLKSTQNKLRSQDQMRKSLEAKFEKRLVKEIQLYSDKTSQLKHLCRLTESKYSLLEERSVNWQKALDLLSSWVIVNVRNTQASELGKDQTSLGAKVAAALELTNSGNLVEDEFSNLQSSKNQGSEAQPKQAVEIEPELDNGSPNQQIGAFAKSSLEIKASSHETST